MGKEGCIRTMTYTRREGEVRGVVRYMYERESRWEDEKKKTFEKKKTQTGSF